MSNNNDIAHKDKIFAEKVIAISRKLLSELYREESVNIRLSCVLSMLLTVAQEVPPKDQFVIGACLEDCLKILGLRNRTDTIH